MSLIGCLYGVKIELKFDNNKNMWHNYCMINAPRLFTPEEKAAYNSKWYPRTKNTIQPLPVDVSPIFGLSRKTAVKYLSVVSKMKKGYTLQESCQFFDVKTSDFRRACKNHASLQKRVDGAEQTLVELSETSLKKSALGLAQEIQEIFEVDENGMQKLCRKVITTKPPDIKAINKILTNLSPEKWAKDKQEIQNTNINAVAISMPTVKIGENNLVIDVGEEIKT